MSLILVKQPIYTKGERADSLKTGTWFMDRYDQIFLTALDDRNNEKRAICVGDFCEPFIPNIPLCHIDVDRVLVAGTILQIVSNLETREEQ